MLEDAVRLSRRSGRDTGPSERPATEGQTNRVLEHPARRLALSAASLLALAVLLATGPNPPRAAQDPAPPWIDVDYAALVDGRKLTHSGESVESILRSLGGRPLPARGVRNADALSHANLDPLLEPYAFVLADALDSMGTLAERASVEVGALYVPGEAQPAWAEILRARRFLVESDGTGHLRACLPLPRAEQAAFASQDPADAARTAFEAAWPVLRHVFAAEQRRLARAGKDRPEEHLLELEVHAYVHEQARTLFHLGVVPFRTRVTDTRARGDRPPLDLEALRTFLDRGPRLEGGRLDADGSLRLLASESREKPTLLGRPLSLADLAVAYRAVAHGGLAEPYMSLDRGSSPEMSSVNYGGRLSDTVLGLVSLLCDVRFKTFSQGIDIVQDRDVRESLRREIPSFATHLERMAMDPRSQTIQGQQTRLWFYPDAVDLTLSEQGDVLVVRRSRMTASSERIQEGGSGREAAPWTLDTVAAINRDYQKLGRVFPELDDLDRVAGLLSLFTWLDEERANGLPVPDLDALLALELPALPTPRRFPQLLAYNALPPAAGKGAVEVFSRIPVAEALDRLQPSSGSLSAARRFERALQALDRRNADHAALAKELEAVDRSKQDDSDLDLQSYRAERLRLHQLVLQALPAAAKDRLKERESAGEKLRVFSVGIGGLDLGMRKSLERASARSEGLAPGQPAASGAPPTSAGPTVEAREDWRKDSPGLPQTLLPDHGGAGARGLQLVESGNVALENGDRAGFLLTVMAKDGPDPRSRRLVFDAARRVQFVERVEGQRFVRYRLEREAATLRARPVERGLPGPERAAAGSEPPEGLALLELPEAAATEAPTLLLRLRGTGSAELAAPIPRPILIRLVLGRDVDLSSGQPLPGLGSPRQILGSAGRLMVLVLPAQRMPPWEAPSLPLAGEENPVRLAAALGAWWRVEQGAPPVVVGTDPARSPGRWKDAPAPAGDALLVLPPDAFPAPSVRLRDEIRTAWKGRSAEEPAAGGARLVVLVSAEAPSLLGGRLRKLALDPRLRGKLLAVYSLAGPVREDLPASLLQEGGLAGLGVAEAPPAGVGRVAALLSGLSASVVSPEARGRRVEDLPGPFLWFF